MTVLHRFFNSIWYQPNALAWLFWPLACVFGCLVQHRRRQYLGGKKAAFHPAVPVIVVGNISVGGTGKTPVSIWLLEELKRRGLRPGLVSRGYGGKAPSYPYLVSETDEASVTGDEPLMIHLRTGVPVVVDPDRSRAVRYLLRECDVNVIISDDGLQHYPLARTVELAIVDGSRGFGNGKLMPMGPLREPVARLQTVDAIVVNGGLDHTLGQNLQIPADKCFDMTLQPDAWRPLHTRAGDDAQPWRGDECHLPVHALAGIGHPQRFFQTLDQLQIPHQPHPFPDHHDYTELDVEAFESGWVLTTEKDAVKLRKFAQLKGAYLPMNARVQPGLIDVIIARLDDFDRHHRHLY